MSDPARDELPLPTDGNAAALNRGDLSPLAIPPTPRLSRSEPSARVIPSGDLLGSRNEVLIEHAGSLYRLRLTRNGKLILHK